MVTVSVLSERERREIQKKLEEYKNLDVDNGEDLTDYLFSEYMSDGEVEVRFFPAPQTAPIEKIHFEISIKKSADWYEELGVYSADNLRNGGEVHQALAEELESTVQSALGKRPDFVQSKGGGVFSCDVPV